MCMAPAEDIGHGLADLRLVCSGIMVDERLGRQDDTADTKAALNGLFVDEGLLDGMRPLQRAESLERDDGSACSRTYRRHAGADGVALHHHRTRAALPEAAAEFRPVQIQVVGQDVK